MKISPKVVLVLFVFTAALSNSCFAQIVGKIFAKEEADKLFGNVVEYVKITPAELKTVISGADNYVMFKLVGGEARILRDDRKAIYPGTDAAVGKQDVYKKYSKLLVIELLEKSKGEMVYLEQRSEVFSITFGAYTLEQGIPCPPYCEGIL